jgi:hypothetical protein
MESVYNWLYVKRQITLRCAILVIGLIQLCFYWRGKSLDTILSEDPQDPELRYRKRKEGGAFEMVLVGIFLIVYSALAR